MKRYLIVALPFLCVLGGSPSVGAESKPSAPPSIVSAEEMPGVAGRYLGTWTSSDGATGELRLTFRQDGERRWVAEATFTFEGADVATKVKAIQVDGMKVQLSFDWRIQDTPGQSKLTGELNNDRMKGSYESSTADGATKGTWTVMRN